MKSVETSLVSARRSAFLLRLSSVHAWQQCSGSVNEFTVFADPGRYQFYSCETLAVQQKYWTGSEQELKLLMDKAKEGTGGALVSGIAYQGDYVATREELKVIEATARIKKCKIPDDPQRQ